MGAILGLKRYELATGRVFMAGARPRLRAFFRRAFFFVERVLPNLAAHEARRVFGAARRVARAAAARGILFAEQNLERLLQSLRRLTAHHPRADTAASPFLREVAEHKKKLQEEREDED